MTGGYVNYLVNLHPVLQALMGTLFTWFLTALGAGGVFLRGVD
jgi:ZIP family zinc transporter